MSYCLNPACTNPQNSPQDQTCGHCGEPIVLQDRYRATHILGIGGFATTFLAVDQTLPGTPQCVIKQLRPDVSRPEIEAMARTLFQREAATLGHIGHHPQVPRLLDYFELDQNFYLVQEYVEGPTLKQEINRFGPFSEPMVATLLRELLPLVDFIHSQGVIHRDIKPANIIRRSLDNKLILIDFGAVKEQMQSATTAPENTRFTSFAVGTSGYAPPEQFALRPVYGSDIYSLGVTCLTLLSGKSPKHWDYDPVTGALNWQHHVSISPDLYHVFDRMLALSTQDRYQSAKEVLAALVPDDQTADLPPLRANAVSGSDDLTLAFPTEEVPLSLPVRQNLEAALVLEGRADKAVPVITVPPQGIIPSAQRVAAPTIHQPSSSRGAQRGDGPQRRRSPLGLQPIVRGGKHWRVWLGGGGLSIAMMMLGFGFSQIMENRQLAQRTSNPTPPTPVQASGTPRKSIGNNAHQDRTKSRSQSTTQQQNITRLEQRTNSPAEVAPANPNQGSNRGPRRNRIAPDRRTIEPAPAPQASRPIQSVPSIPALPLSQPLQQAPTRPVNQVNTPTITPQHQPTPTTTISPNQAMGGAGTSSPDSLPLPESESHPHTQPDAVAQPFPTKGQPQAVPRSQSVSPAATVRIPNRYGPDITTHDIANAIVRGLLVANRTGEVQRWSKTYMQVQDVVYRLRLGQNRYYAAQRSGVSQALIEKLLRFGGLPPAKTQRPTQHALNVLN